MAGRSLTASERAARREKMAAKRAAETPQFAKDLQAAENRVQSTAKAISDHATLGAATALTRKGKARIRGGFAGQTLKLGVRGEIPGYVMHVFLDEPGKIEFAQDCGWEFVERGEVELTMTQNVTPHNTDLGNRIRYIMNKHSVSQGNAQYGYLMKLRQEFWDEDQAIANDAVDRTERAMVRNQGADADKVGNATLPKGREVALEIGHTRMGNRN